MLEITGLIMAIVRTVRGWDPIEHSSRAYRVQVMKDLQGGRAMVPYSLPKYICSVRSDIGHGPAGH